MAVATASAGNAPTLGTLSNSPFGALAAHNNVLPQKPIHSHVERRTCYRDGGDTGQPEVFRLAVEEVYSLSCLKVPRDQILKARDMTSLDSRSDRRRAPRMALQVQASLRDPGRADVPIRVIDISPYGCRVEVPTEPSLSRNMWIYLGPLGAQYIRVVWHSDTFAGLEFATPLNDAALEILFATQGAGAQPTMAELYDVALRTRERAAGTLQPPAIHELLDLAQNCAAAVLHQLLNNTVEGDLNQRRVSSPKIGMV